MPLRSPKMYFCIFGFQRLVWWPKCTPASSSSFIVNVAIRLSPPPSPPWAPLPPPCSPAEPVPRAAPPDGPPPPATRRPTRSNAARRVSAPGAPNLEGVRDGVHPDYVVYFPLIPTYSSDRSHVQTRSWPRPSRSVTASTPCANCRSAGPGRSRGAVSASPLARIATVSLVD